MVTKYINMLSLGKRIKKARESAGFTQEELAERIGTSRAAIARYESGDIEPRLEKLIAIAKTLGVSTDYLLDVGDEELELRISREAYKALMTLLHEVKGDGDNEK